MARRDLPFGQPEHLGLDTAGARREAVGDVGDAHDATVRHVGNNARVRTVVFCHAHPDDEALLTAGTMAKAAAAGHRVVVVMATDGAAGLARSSIADVAGTRAQELTASAEILGVHRVVNLDYPDSGLDGGSVGGFCTVAPDTVAQQIAQVLSEERADIVVGYDAAGGYGHPDHVHVHRVVRAAARATGVRLFEATLPREPIARAVHAAARLRLTPAGFDASEFDRAWTPRAQITHRVNVRPFLHLKRSAQAAHASQASADGGVRTLQVLGRLPAPLARMLLGTEFYVEVR
jgi:LmbE family N-acetylglucosaminyl deacetylase